MRVFALLLQLGILISQSNTSFDPSLLIDPEPRWPEILNPLTDSDTKANAVKSLDSNITEIEGFRVQVFATQDRNMADQLQRELVLKFDEKVYIVFEAPNYKLRVGDFLDRENAERLRKRLVSSDFPSSWIVRTRIQPELKE